MMNELSARAQDITLRINCERHTMDERRALFAELTDHAVPDSFRLFPPFYTDCGINTQVGEGTFVNACCNFQDQGGIRIGNDCLLGHDIVIATLNHVEDPLRRGDMTARMVIIEDYVWIGSHATICPGVTIGYGSIIGAGAVVTKDIPPLSVAVGVPARVIRQVEVSDQERLQLELQNTPSF
ncbi:MAG: sugar O-acetyltransferase [Clostridia bacterium]|nr:sugar O-acetyltransferase [Clostridia bacterium]